MLSSLGFKNFKSWPEIQFDLGKITAFFGTNSSGKTSILQVLLMLKQTTDSADRRQVIELGNEKTPVSLGMFEDIIFEHDSHKKLQLNLAWQQKQEEQELSLDYGFSVDIAQIEQGHRRLEVDAFSYHIAQQSYGMKKDNKTNAYRLEPKGDLKKAQGRPYDITPPPTKCYGFPDELRLSYQNGGILADLELAFENFFKHVYYLGPLRDYPKRVYTWAGSQPADMGHRGEDVVDALLVSREYPLKKKRGKGAKITVETKVAEWLKALGLIENFSIERIGKDSNLYRVMISKYGAKTKVAITDVGIGVSQILPVLTLCYYVPKGSIIILEQPEIHLHPSVQAGLADVFIDAVKTRNIQIILESHSEHLLKRFQRRIAEELLTQDSLKLYFCKFEEGRSGLEPLKLDLFGNITNWPKDFFGDSFTEMSAMAKAQLQRKLKTP
ncbi:MAG: DUF3696 domain-containing protein [Deinococcales bacterium]